MKSLNLFCMATILTASPVLSELPLISARGKSEQMVKPDKAEVTFRILSHAVTAEDALAALEVTSASVIELIKVNEIEETAISATEMRKSEVRKTEDQKRLEILGYDFSQNFTIKLGELSSYQPLVKGLSELDGVTSIRSSFDTSEREKLEDEVTQAACQNAKKNAKALARGMDVELGDVQSISLQPYDYNAGPDDFFGALELGGSGESGGSRLFFIPDVIRIEEEVYARFEIIQ